MTHRTPPLIEPGVLPVFRLFTGLMWLLLSVSVVPQLGRPNADGFLLGLWAIMGALFVLLALPWFQRRLGRGLLPLAIAGASLGPLLADATFPQGGDQGRLYFWLMLPLLLVSAQYGLRSLLLFTAAVTMLPLLLAGPRLADQATLQQLVSHAAGRLIIFLVAGLIVVRISQAQRRLRQELAARNHELAELAATREQLAISHERNRLARELHDTLAHTLSAVNVQLKALDVLIDQDRGEAKALVRRLQDQTRDGLGEARRALVALRAKPVEELGLLAALRHLATQAAERAGTTLQLQLPEALPPLLPYREQQLYQIAVEALANVARHARAGQLRVTLAILNAELVLEITDDGVGFVPAASSGPGQFGLRGMAERAALIDGALELRSQPDAGTTLLLRAPLEALLHRRAGTTSSPATSVEAR